MRASVTALTALAMLACLSLSRAAVASPSFPGVVASELDLAAAPACTLCHTSPSGGAGTANTAFASYLKSRGLRPGDDASLRTALQAMIGERHDTDEDGVLDVDELKSGGDPSGDADTSVPPIGYGCGARIAPSSTAPAPLSVAIAAVAVSLLARRRRRPV